MKQLLLIIIAFFSVELHAQYTITTASSPVAGDVHSTVDTYSAGITIPATGANKLWDYSNLSQDTSGKYSVTFTPVSSAPNASLFPSATIAASDGQGSYEMYGVSSSTLGYLGSAVATASDCSVFSNSILYMAYPFAYGNSFFDNFAVSNSQYSMTGTLSTIADGTGTLVLPGYTFNNVLKTTMSYTQNVAFGTSNVIVQSINHNFYSAASKFEVFSVISQTTASGTSTVTELYGQLNKQFVTGIKENPAQSSFALYPVPCKGETVQVTLATPGQQLKIIINDVCGREIKQESLHANGKTTFALNLKDIPPGIYYVKLESENSRSVRKLVIE